MRNFGPRWGRLVIGACVVILVAACAGRDPGAIDDPLKLKSVSINMEAGANGNQPARVELVRVPDERLMSELVSLDAAAWFGREGEAFRGAHPKAVYDRWEPVPGLSTGPHDVRLDGKYAGVLFCETREGSPPLRVERDGTLTIVIDDSGCRIEGGKHKESIVDRLRRSKFVELSFAVSAQANRNRPVRVELVRVGQSGLVDDLARLAGAAWFGEGGRLFRRAHPDALVDNWELVPGGSYGPFKLAVNESVNGVLFCGASARSALKVPWRRNVEVEIDIEGCRLLEQGRNRWRWNPLTWGGWQ